MVKLLTQRRIIRRRRLASQLDDINWLISDDRLQPVASNNRASNIGSSSISHGSMSSSVYSVMPGGGAAAAAAAAAKDFYLATSSPSNTPGSIASPISQSVASMSASMAAPGGAQGIGGTNLIDIESANTLVLAKCDGIIDVVMRRFNAEAPAIDSPGISNAIGGISRLAAAAVANSNIDPQMLARQLNTAFPQASKLRQLAHDNLNRFVGICLNSAIGSGGVEPLTITTTSNGKSTKSYSNGVANGVHKEAEHGEGEEGGEDHDDDLPSNGPERIGYSTEPPHYVIFAYQAKGSLHELLQNEDFHLDNDLKYSFVDDVSSGLQYLHQQAETRQSSASASGASSPNSAQSARALAHGYLNTRNILLDARFTAKLTDYGIGFARSTEDLRPLNLERMKRLTDWELEMMAFRAPELLQAGMSKHPDGTHAGDVYRYVPLMLLFRLRTNRSSTCVFNFICRTVFQWLLRK